VKVAEKSTGELSFGAGFSTADGPLGNVGMRERNLLGKGYDLRAQLNVSGRRSTVDVSFTDPYFLDKELSAGVDVFHRRFDRKESSFEERNTGASVRIGYDLAEYTRHTISYTASYDEVKDVDDGASDVIKKEEGTDFRSIVGHDIVYDRRDSKFDPREGYYVAAGMDFAGLGGTVTYLRNTLGGGYFYSFKKEVTLGVTGEVGYIRGLGDEVRVTDAFFLGGQNLRGFATGGVGPRDSDTDDALGGKFRFEGTVQAAFPLGLPEEYQIRGRVFSDFGTLTGTDFEDDIDLNDSSSLRASVGVGLTWVSPFGPLAVDLAYPVLKESFDEKELFRFSVGTTF
ncbi:MAG: outer membrane protein assembly factor BamA, partial [Dongiaceae bacterium]